MQQQKQRKTRRDGGCGGFAEESKGKAKYRGFSTAMTVKPSCSGRNDKV